MTLESTVKDYDFDYYFMQRHQPHSKPTSLARMAPVQRFGFMGVFLGVVVLCLGVATLLKSKLQYSNYWGGPVFAPFAVLIGTLAIYVGIVSLRKAGRER